MSDEEEVPSEDVAEEEPQAEEEEPQQEEEAPEAPAPRASPKPRASPRPRPSPAPSGGHTESNVPTGWIKPTAVPKAARPPVYSAGKPSKHDKAKLMAGDGIIPLQSGSNKYDSQKGMTGFGVPRDVNQVSKVTSANIKDVTDEAKLGLLRTSERMQSGTNHFASQKGSGGFGQVRDVLSKTKGTGGITTELPEEKVKASDGIIPLQMGTNKLASQRGMTGFGMPRIVNVDTNKNPDQTRDSQGFIHLQMGTNKFANQAGMTGFGMPRNATTKTKDEARPPIPYDDSLISKQTTGWKEGASQAGSRGFSARRPETSPAMEHQDRKSQGLIPYQMGINWGDSQQGKTAFGCPRQAFTPYTDDKRPELPDELARMPYMPFWSGCEDFPGQSGMNAPGCARDVHGKMIRKLW